MARIAVVGAGLAGLVLARELARDHEVVVYEKSRGQGGRIATRYAGQFEFDHGAQYFTAHTSAFRDFLRPLIESGRVAPWLARSVEISGSTVTGRREWGSEHPRYVGVPRMNVIGKALADELDVRTGCRVTGAQRVQDGWELELADESEPARADWLLVTAPLAQSRQLLADNAAFTTATAARHMFGCYALMLGFDESPGLQFDAARVEQADISWVAVNSSKPGRGVQTTIVVHSGNRWAEANMDSDPRTVLDHMLREVSRVTGLSMAAAVHRDVHRWRYAKARRYTGATHYLDAGQGLGVAGDWFIRGRVEAAFTSANALLSELRPLLG